MAANAAPSSEQANVEPASLEEKLKLADVLVVDAGGPASMVDCGAVRSPIVHVYVAGVGSTSSPALTARTESV